MNNNHKILNIYFATNQNCNLSCKHCYLSFDNNQKRKNSDAKILNSLDNLIEKIEKEGWKIGKFCLHGAEPSLMSSKTIGRIINYINNHWEKNNIKNLAVSIQTNGVRLTKSYLEEILELIEDPKKFRIGFSFDPPKTVHDYMRDGSYDVAFKNYKMAKQLGFPSAILCVISLETMCYIEEFGNWIKKELNDKGKNGNPYKLKAKLATGRFALNEKQINYLTKFLIKNDIISIMQIFSLNYCIQMGNECEWYEFDVDGNCYSCNKNFHTNSIFANWTKETFETIKNKRKNIFKNEYVHPECSLCCYEMYCNSGCPIDRYKTGKMKGKAHECIMIKLTYKNLEVQGISISEFLNNNK